LANALENLARRLLDLIDTFTPKKLQAASVLDLVVSAGIATDKMLALQGMPTRHR
jgi:hypothetical protein